MAGTSRYRTSNHVRTVRGSDDQDYRRFGGRIWNASGDTVIYHSLFGNARAVDQDVVRTLRGAATESVSLQQLESILPDESLRELMAASMLVPDDRDERRELADLRSPQRQRITSGALMTTLQLVLINSCDDTCQYCFAYNADGSVARRDESGHRCAAPPPRLLPPATKPDTRQTGCGLMPGYGPGGPLDGPADATRAMPFSIAARSVRQAVATRRDHGAEHLTIHLCGAEPTLHRNLIKQLLALFGNEHDGVTITWQLTTNGSYLPRDLLDALVAARVGVEVSVDYVSPGSGGYRGGIEQSTRWNTVQTNIRRLLSAGLDVRISSVLSAATWQHWNHEIVDFAAAMGVSMINVVVAFQQSFFVRHPPAEVAEKLLAAYDYAQHRGVTLAGYWYHIFLLLADQQKWRHDADYRTCPAVGGMLSVEPTGSVYSCTMTNDYLGEVADWLGVFASEAYTDYATRPYRTGSACTGCELEGTCAVGALRRSWQADDRPRGYCEYIRTVVDGLLSRHVGRHRARPALLPD